jgi:ACS family hexuronate transporter-like MFS transporter
MWVCACIVPFTSLVVKASGEIAVLALLGIATFFIQAFFANIFALPADLFPHEKVASVFGLNTMAGGLAGFFTVQGAGYIVERFSFVPMFVGMAFFLPAAALCTQLLVRPAVPVTERMSAVRV